MKQKKQLLWISTGVVAVLLVILALFLYFGIGEASIESEKIPFIQQQEFPTSVKITNQGSEYDIVQNGQNEDGETAWSVAGYEQIPQYDLRTSEPAEQMKTLYAEKIFTPVEDLSAYGLDNPTATVIAFYPDGSSKTLKLGNENPDSTGRYAQLDEQQDIALISAGDAEVYMQTPDDYVDLTLVPYVQTTDDNGNELPGIESCTITRSDLTAPIVMNKGDDDKLQIVSPQGMQLSDENQTLMENSISSLTAQSVESVNPSEQELSDYGLAQPAVQVDYKINGEEYTLLIGNISKVTETVTEEDASSSVPENEYYVMVSGRPVVYSVMESSLPWVTVSFS